MEKQKRIEFLSNELSNIQRDKESAKGLVELPLAEIRMYNGSGEEKKISVWYSLSRPLMEFLTAYYENEQEKVYEQMRKEFER